MAKPPKAKNNGDTKVKRHHKRNTVPVNPLAKFKPAEVTAYDRYLMAENQLTDMRKKVLSRNSNLPDMSFEVLEFVVHNTTIPYTHANCPRYEIDQFNHWCESLRKHEAYMETLKDKCKRILEEMK